MNRFRHSLFLPTFVSPLNSVREGSSCKMRYSRWDLSVTQVLVRHSAVPHFTLCIGTRYRRTFEPGNSERVFAYKLLNNPKSRNLTPKGKDWFYKYALKPSGNVIVWQADPKSTPSKLLTKKKPNPPPPNNQQQPRTNPKTTKNPHTHNHKKARTHRSSDQVILEQAHNFCHHIYKSSLCYRNNSGGKDRDTSKYIWHLLHELFSLAESHFFCTRYQTTSLSLSNRNQ